MAETTSSSRERSLETQLLEFISGLLALEGASTGDRIALAARVGLSSATVARILGMNEPAARKALQRSKKRTSSR